MSLLRCEKREHDGQVDSPCNAWLSNPNKRFINAAFIAICNPNCLHSQTLHVKHEWPMSHSPHASGDVLNDELVKDSMHKPVLPAGSFKDVHISASKRHEYSEIVQRRVNTLLADDSDRTDLHQEAEWKLFRRIDDVNVYQRRLRGRAKKMAAAYEEFPEAALAVERGNPSMKVEGTARGTIEDILFGASATTQAEMLTGMSLMAPLYDAALLSAVDKSTEEDPLRSLDVIWMLTKLPVMHSRDFCYLKATGTGIDPQGRGYGYSVLHSVEIPECPPFDYRRTKMLRAKLFFSFLYRESAPGYVSVTGRGIFDLDGGELLKLVLPHFTTSLINAILQGASCGEAKKLTLLALRNASERSQGNVLTKKSVCSMCIRRNQRMLPGARLRSCDGCGVPVCMSCKMKDKRIFLGTKQPSRSAVCCMTCAYNFKNITNVRLGAPEFIVEAEFYQKPRSRLIHSSSRLPVARVSPSSHSSESSGLEARRDNSAAFNSTTSNLPDPGIPAASVVMTSSTTRGSCASSVAEVRSSRTLSDGNSSFKEGEHRDENGSVISIGLIEVDTEDDEETDRIDWNDIDRVATCPVYPEYDTRVISVVDSGTPYETGPDFLLEKMRELQTSADEAYSTAKANGELMKKFMR